MLLAVLLANLHDAVAVLNHFGRVLRTDRPDVLPSQRSPMDMQDDADFFRLAPDGGRRSFRWSCALHDGE